MGIRPVCENESHQRSLGRLKYPEREVSVPVAFLRLKVIDEL